MGANNNLKIIKYNYYAINSEKSPNFKTLLITI